MRAKHPRVALWVGVATTGQPAVFDDIVESSYAAVARHRPGFPTKTEAPLHAEWTYTEPRRQKAMLFLLQRLPMNRMISRMWASALDRYALSQDS